ncbi:Endothelin-converting enzyme 2 [Giardia muris]|uniref:Endothelin-converting enzyme 2 n=1 Tax=Giardia muris TaxID=5742 RepID=A0A4Z1SYC6_GIAMU|nr:Endothelin-converting enzyme 2 [Giardia muris]|eukprot:TNJ28508.1 Endothelin-converting enzyme 2 [Giardia muris]
MTSYHLPEYWDQRYQADTEIFEWYQRYSDLRPKIQDVLPKNGRCLVVGAGSSELSFNLYDDPDAGIKDIVSIDVSQVIVRRMQGLVGDRKGCEFTVMSVMDLTYPDAAFDVVIDKGTLDSLLCGENGKETSTKALEQIFRVLKPQGYYICVSYANPDMRMVFFTQDSLDWDIEIRETPKPKLLDNTAPDEYYYIYLMKKRGDPVMGNAKGKK